MDQVDPLVSLQERFGPMPGMMGGPGGPGGMFGPGPGGPPGQMPPGMMGPQHGPRPGGSRPMRLPNDMRQEYETYMQNRLRAMSHVPGPHVPGPHVPGPRMVGPGQPMEPPMSAAGPRPGPPLQVVSKVILQYLPV